MLCVNEQQLSVFGSYSRLNVALARQEIETDHPHGLFCLNTQRQDTDPRMVLVHVGYLVLPVFGSVRNRGICLYLILSIY